MQCNGSDGARLPGLWDNIPATPVKLPLAPPARNCFANKVVDDNWMTS